MKNNRLVFYQKGEISQPAKSDGKSILESSTPVHKPDFDL
jgi:hypothetical protein